MGRDRRLAPAPPPQRGHRPGRGRRHARAGGGPLRPRRPGGCVPAPGVGGRRPRRHRRGADGMTGTLSWLRIRTIARRHAFVLQRAPQRWFDVVFWPVVDAILFGSLGVYFARTSGGGKTSVGFLLAGILLFHVVFQAEISLATGFMEETWSRNLLNLLVTPLREGEYAAGVVLFGLAKLAIGVTVVGLVALGLFAFNITDVGLALVPIVALLLVVGWSVGMIVICLILRVGQGAEILAW